MGDAELSKTCDLVKHIDQSLASLLPAGGPLDLINAASREMSECLLSSMYSRLQARGKDEVDQMISVA